MKQILFSLFLISGLYSYSQVTCTVSPADTTVCYRDSIVFTTVVTGQRPYTYQWLRNGVIITGAVDSILPVPKVDYPDTGTYLCILTNAGFSDTSNTAGLHMLPKMKIDTLYRYNDLGCPGSCKGQFKALVSGGAPPYKYNWGAHGFSQDTIIFGLCEGSYTFKVTDQNKCMIDSAYFVDVLKIPDIDILTDPGDTIYLTKPTITASLPDTSVAQLLNWEWRFGKSDIILPNQNPASYIFPNDSSSLGTQKIRLYFTDLDGCVDSVDHEILVKVAKLKIPNIFTPDGNNINDTFEVKLEDSELNFSDVYMSTDLTILDRWGRHIYSKTDYVSGEWDGKNASDGAYFYILTCKGYYGTETYKGSVTILRDK
jgi:gliding motility-associated-like protein